MGQRKMRERLANKATGEMDSRRTGSIVDSRSDMSDRLSYREVERLKRWVAEKDREERKDNIVIKRVRLPKKKERDKKESRE